MQLISLNLPDPPEFKMAMGATSTLANPSADLVQALIGFPTVSGKIVTRETSIRVACFLAAVKTLAADVAKMPLVLRETVIKDGRTRTQPALDEPLYPILRHVSNDWQTSYQLRWYLTAQLVMTGNAYCQIIRDGTGKILKLNPLNAWHMTQRWDISNPKDIRMYWDYSDSRGTNRRFDYIGNDGLPQIWHATNLNIEGSGFEGSAIIVLAKEALSVLMAAEEVAGRNFANGLGMGGFLTFPPDVEVTEPQAQNIVDRLKKDYSGSQNAGKFTALPLGAKFEKMTFNAQESQLLESRKWNSEEVVRMLGGQPLLTKLGYGDKASTYAATSAFLDEYFNTALLPHCVSFEQAISRDLIDVKDRTRLFAKHDAHIILRGGERERAETYEIQIRSGQVSPNDVALLEDRDTLEGFGDCRFFPANSGFYDPETGEYAIPGQATPAPNPDEASTPEKKPADEGSDANEDTTEMPPVDKKVQARLNAIANTLAERVMRKEAKGSIDAKFVAEVLSISKEKAEEYVAGRSKLNDIEARAALVALAEGN